ncbi:type VII secretion protein EssB/YukC [Thermoflavimicrobium daqui]|nr:type VII secretion protein EssB/YukC [Thermoflavimicrobium daqui]
MKEIKFNHGLLGLTETKACYVLTPFEEEDFYKVCDLTKVLPEENISFNCELDYIYDQNALCIKYFIDPGFAPLQEVNKHHIFITRLDIAKNMIKLGKLFEEYDRLNTILSPLNLFINRDGEVRILYYGIKGVLPAEGFDESTIFQQIKDLIIYVIEDEVIEEDRTHLINDIHRARIYHDLEDVIQREINAITTELEKPVSYDDDPKPIELEVERRKKPSKKGGKVFLVTLSLMITIIACIIFFDVPSLVTKSKATPKNQIDPRLLEGTKLAAIQKYKEAARLFHQLDYKKLSKQDRNIVLFTYLYAEPDKAFELEPELSKSLIQAFIEKKQFERAFQIAKLAKKKGLMLDIKKQELNEIKKASLDEKEKKKRMDKVQKEINQINSSPTI